MLGNILWAIIAGLVLGVIAKLILPGKQNISLWLTILVGIVAAFLGGYIADRLGVGQTSGVDWVKHIIQVVLAVIGVGLVAGISGRKGVNR